MVFLSDEVHKSVKVIEFSDFEILVRKALSESNAQLEIISSEPDNYSLVLHIIGDPQVTDVFGIYNSFIDVFNRRMSESFGRYQFDLWDTSGLESGYLRSCLANFFNIILSKNYLVFQDCYAPTTWLTGREFQGSVKGLLLGVFERIGVSADENDLLDFVKFYKLEYNSRTVFRTDILCDDVESANIIAEAIDSCEGVKSKFLYFNETFSVSFDNRLVKNMKGEIILRSWVVKS